ncbi:MAG TPA: glycosyltransferase family 2 protein [Arachidicoccus soli]|nr:glycosyltransferase family 2 protein [Arachidicoccus soli]
MLSIIIINFKSAELIYNCIQSIKNETAKINYEIIVVDNSHDEDGARLVTQKFPEVIWLNMGYNAGFARANNKGIQIAKGETILLLNPDTININNSIERTYLEFTASKYVACGVQLLNEDLSPQISGNFAMKGGLNYLLPLPYVGNLLKWIGAQLKVKKPNIPQASSLVEVDWINGAFLMVKKNIIEKAGLLDEDFFLYAEEAEWCGRLQKQGQLCIYGNCQVMHLQGETANDAFNSEGKGYYNLYDRKGLQIMVSNFVRIRKQFGLFWFFFDLFVYTFSIPLFLVVGILHRIFVLQNPFKHFPKLAKFSNNVFYLWKLVPTILKNKPHFYKVL